MSKDVLVDIPLGEKSSYVNIASLHGLESEAVAQGLKSGDSGWRRTLHATESRLSGVGYDGEPTSVGTLAAFLEKGFAKYLWTIGSQIVAVSFAISITGQEFLNSCIFVFVKHPYNVGDRLLINDVHLLVEHISLLYITFKRVDNNRMVHILNIKPRQLITFYDIETCKGESKAFLVHPENKRDFFRVVDVQIVGCKDVKQINLLIGLTHKSNWSNEPLRLVRRKKLMTAVMSALRPVSIYPAGAKMPLSIRPTDFEVNKSSRKQVLDDKAAVVDLIHHIDDSLEDGWLDKDSPLTHAAQITLDGFFLGSGEQDNIELLKSNDLNTKL